ncbi:protein-L-isoaspartate(D-aspartate) O-methyltransferase [Alkalitalea saponilacus]|uniref:Protein-L-isoaspartate O-methyltransferase n=1 Tax=Alkalitalea saponilacus TaxID=889453 RepID=A0A1T5BEW9_9BACT|nr:protein-L-isoaspartate(D-aspartate) O-methyltransferase [Alkalitalea saponilacus]ASB49709.1 protein-L-isoaspartate O-methyltransferase [Alkalitalea saponilacus]SKB45569.1 protein-L-isoaspartate(D-aspartate) O-methyltransferase [Alkalitalea saponilacus]
MLEDSFRHKGLRARLVDEVRKKGITDEKVLEAIGSVPRHVFLDSSFVKYAYKDMAFPIGAGQTISQPSTVALQTSLLKVKPGDKILEVGTGSGYQAAVLCEMGVHLFSIERQPELYSKTKIALSGFKYRKLRLFLGDGYEGLPGFAPFDAIIVTAGASEVPASLLMQLKTGGIMVIPVGTSTQVMTRIIRISDQEFEKEEFGKCAFVPMLSGVAQKQL